jgi:hypothetical protein
MRRTLVHVVGLYMGGGLIFGGGLIVGGLRYKHFLHLVNLHNSCLQICVTEQSALLKQFSQRLHSFIHAVHVLNKSLRYFSLTSNIQRKNTWYCKFEVCSLLKYLKIV